MGPIVTQNLPFHPQRVAETAVVRSRRTYPRRMARLSEPGQHRDGKPARGGQKIPVLAGLDVAITLLIDLTNADTTTAKKATCSV